jgi:hypothetical protein
MKFESSRMMTGTVRIVSAPTATTASAMIASVARRRPIPSRSSPFASGSSRYASAIPATNGSRTSRSKIATAIRAAKVAIQNTIGRVVLMRNPRGDYCYPSAIVEANPRIDETLVATAISRAGVSPAACSRTRSN